MTVIEKAVNIITENGYQTIEWFEPDFGIEACVRFEGKEFDLIKMHGLMGLLKFSVLEAKRVYNKNPTFDKNGKEIGKNWTEPFNEVEQIGNHYFMARIVCR